VDCARQAQLRGWVRNLPDGRVEAEVVGEKDLIDDLIGQLKIGPPASRVTAIDVQWLPEEQDHKSFSIKYF
jgi:acylphosphatase